MLLAALFLAWPSASSAQQIVPERDCCVQIYSTGRWIGWAASFMEATRMRQAPSQFDEPMFEFLQRAGDGLRIANRSCTPNQIEAWGGWTAMVAQLNALAGKLRDPREHLIKRRQIYVYLQGAYNSWGNALAVMQVNRRTIRQTTCATLYFRLGYATAYAAQALRHANEQFNRNNDLLEGQHQMDMAVRHLRLTMQLLDQYDAIQLTPLGDFMIQCVGLRTDAIRQDVQRLIDNAENINMLGPNIQLADNISNAIADVLTNGCVPQLVPVRPPQPSAWTPTPAPVWTSTPHQTPGPYRTIEPEPTAQPGRYGNTRCRAYATTAVQQYREFVGRGCQHNNKNRWQGNFDNHYNWCMRVGESDTRGEVKERRLFLQNQCR